MPNGHLIFWVFQSDHLDRVITEDGELIAEDSFNIVGRWNEDEGPLGWVPFEEQS